MKEKRVPIVSSTASAADHPNALAEITRAQVRAIAQMVYAFALPGGAAHHAQ
jgi:hypothetical protein